jgi:hypothetical protein
MPRLLIALAAASVVKALCPGAAPADAAEFYVSPSGGDNNPGTEARPFATIARARDAVRELKSPADGFPGATVWVREGTYHLGESLAFEPQDSGADGAPVLYSAFPGEKAVLKGSLPVRAQWKPHKDGIYVCSLAGTPFVGKQITQLFCNDKRMVRARFPDWDFDNPLRNGKGYLLCDDGAETEMTWKPGQLDDREGKWRNPQTGIVHCFHSRNWGNMQYRIKDVDWQARRILFGEGGRQCQRRVGPGKGRGSSSPYYVENIFEELDAPHEWFHDTERDLLYFLPPQGVDVATARVEAATLTRLIEFHGSSEEPVRYINLRGLHLTQSQTAFMAAYEDLGRGDWGIHRGGAIYFRGAEDCRVVDCWIEQVGGNGVFLDGYNRRVEAAGCLIEDIGESAVCFVGSAEAVRHFFTWEKDGRDGGEVTDLTPGPKSPDYPEDCSVRNSILRDVGVYGKQTSAVIVSKAMEITISHCTVHRIPRAGITFNDGAWGGHILEHCDIWDTVMETGEHGPFNGWGRDRFWTGLKKDRVLLDALKTIHIRNNRIANLRPAISAGNWTIDLDDGCSNYHIYNNISLGSTLKLRDGYYRKVWNNIHVSAVPLGWHCWPEQSEDVFEKNITVVAGAAEGGTAPTTDMIRIGGAMAEHPWGKRHAQNLWWNVNTSEFAVETRGHGEIDSWEDWRRLGYGEGSVMGDPKFVDPANGDYRVQPDSPALEVGFRNFPMDRFGHEMTRIQPFGGEFEEGRDVTIRADARGGEVCYTLDGSQPTKNSRLYKAPVNLTETTTIRAQTFDNGLAVGFEAKATFTKVDEMRRPLWLECLTAGRWIEPDKKPKKSKRPTAQSQVWRGMKVVNLAEDGDLIDASGGQDYGVYVEAVPGDGAAGKWGFKQADVIIALDGRKTADLDALTRAEQEAGTGAFTITVMRGYGKIDIPIPGGPHGPKQ